MALSAAALVAASVAEAGPCANSGLPGTPYQGYGTTPGGAGKPTYRVTTLADSGPGSLREALADGGRCVVFDVAGTIVLRRQLYVEGAFVTVDGFTAPAPGITLREYGISVWGTNGAHDVIVRGLRIRDAGQDTCAAGQCWDGIQIKGGASRVVIDHVSVSNASDGAIDISDSRDVTVQWSLLSGSKNLSLMNRAVRVSMHHNLFVNGQSRNPQADWTGSRPPGTVLDFRNNLVWGYSAYGTVVRNDATANVVNNYYYSASRPLAAQALVISGDGRVYATGNESGHGADIDGLGTQRSPFSAASVSTTGACGAAQRVHDQAGARGSDFGPDAVDRGYLSKIPDGQLPGCGAGAASPAASSDTGKPDLVVSTLSTPETVWRGRAFSIQIGIANRGTTTASASRLSIYLSTDAGRGSTDVLLGSRSIASLSSGVSQSQRFTETIPTNLKAGSYYLLFAVDGDGAVSELNERNNVQGAAVTVR